MGGNATPLNEFIALQRGHDLPHTDRVVGKIPVVASTGVAGYHNVAKAKAPGVVIGRSGSIGGGQYITEDFWPLNTTLWVNDFKGHNERFVYYLLRSIDFTTFNVGSGVPTLNRNHLSSILVDEIGRNAEDAIAKILGDLDDKIALNTQINQTLEAMAQALFKSWFVDFDPVKAKMEARASGGNDEAVRRAAMAVISRKSNEELVQFEQENPETFGQLAATADLFPEALVESELGLIPEGWEVTTFGEVSSCYDRKRVPLSKRQREEKQGCIPYYGATSVMDYVDEALFDDIYLLLGEDGSVLKPDGTPFIQYIWGKAWVNNHAHVLQGTNGVSTEHLMTFISTQNITAYVTGAVQLKLNQGNMNSIPFLKATDNINAFFAEKLDAIYAQYRCNVEESAKLTKSRDTLLPKLLSGEIDLSSFGGREVGE